MTPTTTTNWWETLAVSMYVADGLQGLRERWAGPTERSDQGRRSFECRARSQIQHRELRLYRRHRCAQSLARFRRRSDSGDLAGKHELSDYRPGPVSALAMLTIPSTRRHFWPARTRHGRGQRRRRCERAGRTSRSAAEGDSGGSRTATCDTQSWWPLTKRFPPQWTAGVFGRLLGYDQAGVGYFSPDRFLTGEGSGSYTYTWPGWEARAGAGLGIAADLRGRRRAGGVAPRRTTGAEVGLVQRSGVIPGLDQQCRQARPPAPSATSPGRSAHELAFRLLGRRQVRVILRYP